MVLDPTLLLVGGAAAVGAVAGHLPGILSWLGSKVTAGKAAVQSAETKAEGVAAAAASFLAHPITGVENAEHAAVQKLAQTGGAVVEALLDESGLDRKITQLQAVKAAMAQVRADIKAKL